MGATSKIWLLGIFSLYIIYLCWLLWIPGEGGMQPWVWSEEMFNQNLSPFCDFLKVLQKMRILQGFKALLVLSFSSYFCSLWVASEGWWLLLQFGWADCKLPPPVALVATDTFFFWEKREFGLCTGLPLRQQAELCNRKVVRRLWHWSWKSQWAL